ncbi:DUF899 family protein [Mesorhizobium sp.]|uniref:DUF899 family protein n=1 Tax=Mesorhizobium sp. TaxID=1871066 RepID=UPI00257DDF5C|nr:DUF899 family protein [Mesorhizobium sp.]
MARSIAPWDRLQTPARWFRSPDLHRQRPSLSLSAISCCPPSDANGSARRPRRQRAIADHFDCVIPHLNGRDITLVCESIAPLQEIQDYKQQMGWRFPWVSSLGSDFKYDFGAAFTEEQQRDGAEYNYQHVDRAEPQKEGMSVFALQDGAVYHTYSTYARGTEAFMGVYRFLDLAPRGRNENGLEFPQAWWRRHDEYGNR